MSEFAETLREKIAWQKAERLEQFELFETAALAAKAAANEAATTHVPEPMHVVGYERPVMGGLCGFAWLEVPGNRRLGRWLKTNVGFRKCYTGGLTLWCPLGTQSMSTKEAWCKAYAETFNAQLADAGMPDRLTWASSID